MESRQTKKKMQNEPLFVHLGNFEIILADRNKASFLGFMINIHHIPEQGMSAFYKTSQSIQKTQKRR